MPLDPDRDMANEDFEEDGEHSRISLNISRAQHVAKTCPRWLTMIIRALPTRFPLE